MKRERKPKILIDLDVVTVAEWDSDKKAVNFISRVKAGEFTVYTPPTSCLNCWVNGNIKN